ncbi:hypothetical protein GQ55_4G099800 [Panicum hallii var. hallii]|uniref:Uncharacterized protein n=1 Tax=Panicum hallii var. hallii TaxID=1504633 RepID=A0A2T7DX26_9POAL|nr:hypothetical protein GQ55_4G099800 [Panicum hallii var. hallii]
MGAARSRSLALAMLMLVLLNLALVSSGRKSGLTPAAPGSHVGSNNPPVSSHGGHPQAPPETPANTGYGAHVFKGDYDHGSPGPVPPSSCCGY